MSPSTGAPVPRTERPLWTVEAMADAMKAARAIYVARGFQRAPDLDFVQGSMPVYGFRLEL